MNSVKSLLIALCAVLALFAQAVVAQTNTTIGHKVLFLVNAEVDQEGRQAVENGLNGYGIPYTVLPIAKAGYTGTLPLTDASGNPLYSSIIVQPAQLQYDYGTEGWKSALTQAQWDQINAYEVTHKVRRVLIDDSPRAEHNTAVANPAVWGCCNTGVTQNIALNLPSDLAYLGLKNNGILTTSGLYHVPGSITNTTTTRSFLTLLPSSDGGFTSNTTAGVIVKYDDGREHMAFYLAFGWWSPTSTFLAHIYVPWASRQLYQGFRRCYLHLQIDDVFLATTVPATDLAPEYDYRITAADVKIHTTWQTTLKNALPSGSTFKLTHGFNGNGVLEAIDSPAVIYIDNDQGEYDYIQPLGAGTQAWPSPVPAVHKQYTLTQLKQDPLFVELLGSTTAMNNYWWCSHTYTHEKLNNCSRTDVDNELDYNLYFANVTGLARHASWTSKTMITPSISGLRNGDAIRSMVSRGINIIVGDTSRADITNQTYPFHPWITTTASSNYNGFMAIPRQPTVIYYFSSTTYENTHVYNSFYAAQQGVKDWNYVIGDESDRVLRLLLNLKHDPYMFHQANMRAADQPSVTINGRTNKYSLVMLWAENVLGKLTKLVNWPIIGGASFDEINDSFVRRMTTDNCGVTTKWEKNATHVLGAVVTGQRTCTVPITVPGNVVKNSGNSAWKFEKIGVDPTTVWVPVSAGVTRRLVLSPALKL
ncbi:hypothetical protein HK097_000168 [Rhizophlyctis rosea]|uniref:Uncharacterized protein n=1 Tax=Rhizophlyctis rosea TaxID=64517 RepID=A0AAD5WZ11_9FUNG|nr:hypothetical protein HK097_000168 [Rhizophlyctis rosea]